MDPIDLVALTRTLVDIDSTTGQEADAGRWLAAFLRSRRFQVIEQPVEGTRFNILAFPAPRGGERPSHLPSDAISPVVILSTHYDCVPPFITSREAGGLVFGRGTCDAKGSLAAQIAAADRFRTSGETRVGLLFVVGEERGSDGAAAANLLPNAAAYLINGEPTDRRLARGTRGVLRVKLKATGRAAHSSYPELGESAIEKLIDALVHLRRLELPVDPQSGVTCYTVGLISGGVAPNVVPAEAEAEVLFRTVGPGADVRSALKPLEERVEIAEMIEVPPVTLELVDGFATATFPYTTDVPLLTRWGRPLLFGPGSALVAHTDDEHVRIDELHEAVNDYERIARALLRRIDAGAVPAA